jgi:XTP/dITP diphosphohydrolase
MTDSPRILLVASTNKKKLIELQTLISDLGLKLMCLADLPSYEEVPETGATFKENASLKALGYARQTGYLTLADDSGLSCDALSGEPGVYSARFAGSDKDDDANNSKVLQLLEGLEGDKRAAHFTSAVAIAMPDRLIGVVEGYVHGLIHHEPQGTGGFGYDSIFFYPPYGQTFGQAPSEMKNKISHRAQALQMARELLKTYLHL